VRRPPIPIIGQIRLLRYAPSRAAGSLLGQLLPGTERPLSSASVRKQNGRKPPQAAIPCLTLDIPRLSCPFSRVPDVKSHPLSCFGCHL
jgi:hypothetical protein